MNCVNSMNPLVWQYTRRIKQKGLTMSKNVAYTAYLIFRADFTVPLFMSSDPDIKFGDTATMSLANMMGECLKGMYESVTVRSWQRVNLSTQNVWMLANSEAQKEED